jgi:hypothetical protein
MYSGQAVNCFAKHTEDGQRLLVSLKNFAPESGVTLSSDSLAEMRRLLDKYERQIREQDRKKTFDGRDTEEDEDVSHPPAPSKKKPEKKKTDPLKPGPTTPTPAPKAAKFDDADEDGEDENDPDSQFKKESKKRPLVAYEPPGEISQAGPDLDVKMTTCKFNKIGWMVAIALLGTLFLRVLLHIISDYKRKAQRSEPADVLDIQGEYATV